MNIAVTITKAENIQIAEKKLRDTKMNRYQNGAKSENIQRPGMQTQLWNVDVFCTSSMWHSSLFGFYLGFFLQACIF